jgi:hypothetical protein
VGSHDAVSRWLANSNYNPKTLWAQTKSSVDLSQGYLIIDDTIIEKPHSDEENSELVKWYWSDGHVKGINLVAMLWVHGKRVIPVDYYLIAKGDITSKNDIAREMLTRAKRRGFTGITVLLIRGMRPTKHFD